MLFIEYPKCAACRKAKKFLDSRGVPFEDRHIAEQNPTAEEIRLWQKKSGLPLRKFFNTSGQLYRSLGLKDRLPAMTEEEMLTLLASDGMLVKRPILLTEDAVLVGFREAEWEAAVK